MSQECEIIVFPVRYRRGFAVGCAEVLKHLPDEDGDKFWEHIFIQFSGQMQLVGLSEKQSDDLFGEFEEMVRDELHRHSLVAALKSQGQSSEHDVS